MLTNVKLLLGITDTSKDALLTLLIAQCTADAARFTHNSTTNLDSVICQMVVYRYNMLGTEGVTSESFTGVSYNYNTDYPANILSQLKAYRKVQVI